MAIEEHGTCPRCEEVGTVASACDTKRCREWGYHRIPNAYITDGPIPPDGQVGRLIDEYLVVDILGEGGFGKVYLALQQPIQMKVALKLLRPERMEKSETEHLFKKVRMEAQALADLRHPNVVRLHKYGLNDGIPFLVMEYVAGGRTLRDEVQTRVLESRALAPEEARDLIAQLLDGLEAAHALGIIHRDIKPENIMLQSVAGNRNFIRILDFGLARFTMESRTHGSGPAGTPVYMAPEQLKRGEIGPWTDLYAVGVIAFELLTGRRVFGDRQSEQILACKLDPDFKPTDPLAAGDHPHAVISFLEKALAADPDLRFRTTTEFRDALAEVFVSLVEEGAERLHTVDLAGLLSSTERLELEKEKERLDEERQRLQHDRRRIESERMELDEERFRLQAISAPLRRTHDSDVVDTEATRKKRKRVSLRRRVQLLILGLAAFSTLVVAAVAFFAMSQSYESLNQVLQETLEARYRTEIRNQTESLISSLGALDALDQATRDARIKDVVRSTKFNSGRGYFFLYDQKGYVIAHGSDTGKEGKNLWDLKGPDGKYIIRELQAAALSGGGYVSYHWDKPDDLGELYPKLGYAKSVPETGWWVGTGVYLDDVDKVMAREGERQKEALRSMVLNFAVAAALVLITALLLGLMLGARISKPIIQMSEAADHMARGDFTGTVSVKTNDEMGDLAHALNRMGSSVSQMISALVKAKQYSTRILDGVADGLVVTDHENTIIQVNPAAERIFGYGPGELVGQPLNVLLPTELQDGYKESTLDAVLRGETVVNYDVHRRRKDGSDLFLTIAVAPLLDEAGAVEHRIHSVSDQTEHKRMNDRMAAVERLKQYVSPHLAEQLLAGKSEMDLAYERKKITVMFCDLVGFTAFSETNEPEDVIRILNEFFTAMTKLVHRYGGTLDKFIGDGLMVFFGAPTSQGEKVDAKRCTRLAMEMQQELGKLNERWDLPQPLSMRVGINTGHATVGNFGSDNRKDYTVIGTPVNIAARLERMCPPSLVALTHATRRHLDGEFPTDEFSKISLAGREINTFTIAKS